MIVPIRCFTCGKPITKEQWDGYLVYTNKSSYQQTVYEYQSCPIRPLGHKIELPPAEITQEYMALNLLQVRRMCCRQMYLGTIDMFDKL